MALSRPNDLSAEKLPLHDGTDSIDVPESTASPHPLDNIEFSAPLETLVSLEAPRFIKHTPLNPSVMLPHRQAAVQPNDAQSEIEQSIMHEPMELERSDLSAIAPKPEEAIELQSEASARVVDEALIPLLEERLVIDRHRRKVGEVIVRKEIETYIVEVPVRREKLIVEQISPEYKQLAVVDLGQVQASENSPSNASLPLTVSANFTTAHAAIEFLEAIAAHADSTLTPVQVSVVLADENLQAAYQQWLARQTP